MSLGATELRGTIAVTPIAALRRGLYSFGAGFSALLPAPLPARLRLPPGRGCVGQNFKGDIASIPKLLLVDPFWFSRVWFALVHSVLSFVASLNSLVGFKDNKGKFGNGKISFGEIKNVF
jgi:hypothetical protein